jgi:RNA recognition motif-containing protein
VLDSRLTSCGLEGPAFCRSFRDGPKDHGTPRAGPLEAHHRPFEESRHPIPAKLFVGNLDFGATQDELQSLFAEAGEVVSVTVPTERDSGRPRGFAFVEMATDEGAMAGREKFNGFSLHGRAMRVDAATERPAMGARPGGFDRGPRPAFAPPRSRPKGSRRNLRARKRGL